MPGSPLRRAARAATAPVRGYLNDHFEMVKQEVREHSPEVEIDDSAAWQRVADLENTLAELSLYQSRVLTRLSDEVQTMGDRLDELERLVRQLAAVIAASAVSEP
ncbi:MAG: hypothetical protein QNJ12_06060 [Ilumatobacter sp.]|uniref:hypothetical protein n=1 Tax=Ilumatobacter sp. TaxID=1967498 RepID=UPI0026047A95|nr:hypothetical protein [Ilumatobacter sp.]MDJ0768336.1 hypothetical protein [Ilumatobacter sp.]